MAADGGGEETWHHLPPARGAGVPLVPSSGVTPPLVSVLVGTLLRRERTTDNSARIRGDRAELVTVVDDAREIGQQHGLRTGRRGGDQAVAIDPGLPRVGLGRDVAVDIDRHRCRERAVAGVGHQANHGDGHDLWGKGILRRRDERPVARERPRAAQRGIREAPGRGLLLLCRGGKHATGLRADNVDLVMGPDDHRPAAQQRRRLVGVDGREPLAGAVLCDLIREREGDRLSRGEPGAWPAEIDGRGALHGALPVTEDGADNHDRKCDRRVRDHGTPLREPVVVPCDVGVAEPARSGSGPGVGRNQHNQHW